MGHSQLKVVLQGTLTMLLVVGLYGSSLAVLALQQIVGGGRVTEALYVAPESTGREAIFLAPTPKPAVHADEAPEDSADVDEAPTEVDDAVQTDAPAKTNTVAEKGAGPAVPPGLGAPRGTGVGPSRVRRATRRRVKRRIRVARHPRIPHGTPSRSTRSLDPKEARRRERERKKRERQARRRQCVELADQILEVEPDLRWLGRELVNCYRTHPEQFFAMGGGWWYEEKGKRKGVRIHITRRPAGRTALRSGFRSGDIVLSINGIPLRNEAMGAIAATQMLRGRAKVKILRKGKPRTLRFKVVSEKKLAAKRAELAAVARVDDETP